MPDKDSSADLWRYLGGLPGVARRDVGFLARGEYSGAPAATRGRDAPKRVVLDFDTAT